MQEGLGAAGGAGEGGEDYPTSRRRAMQRTRSDAASEQNLAPREELGTASCKHQWLVMSGQTRDSPAKRQESARDAA